MDERPPGPPEPPRDEVLAAVARATSQVERDIAEQDEASKRPPAHSPVRAVAAGLLSIAALASWLAFPPKVDDTDPRSVAVVERDLRLGIGAVAREVEDFRASKGALPDSLGQVPLESEVVQYRRLDATSYELTASDARASVVYRSSTPLDEFLGGISVGGTKP